MLMVFEVYFEPGSIPDSLLTPDVKRETQAKMMTFEEAKKAGFAGLPTPQGHGEARLIMVGARDGKWIHRLLENTEMVAGFRVHEVDG
jgi:hypothetical protein